MGKTLEKIVQGLHLMMKEPGMHNEESPEIEQEHFPESTEDPFEFLVQKNWQRHLGNQTNSTTFPEIVPIPDHEIIPFPLEPPPQHYSQTTWLLIFACFAGLFYYLHTKYRLIPLLKGIVAQWTNRSPFNNDLEMAAINSQHSIIRPREENSLLIPKSKQRNKLVRKHTDQSPEEESEFELELEAISKHVSSKSRLLSKHVVLELIAIIPKRFSLSEWKLIFSSREDGFSLRTFYSRAREEETTFLVVKDLLGNVFGGFMTQPWKVSPLHIGNGETFVFQAYPSLRIFNWSRKNSSFATARHDYLSFGGGDGFALRLFSDLSKGISQPSSTFDNFTLSHIETFEVHSLELWSLNTRSWKLDL